MLTKQDLHQINELIETAVGQISSATVNALENVATKDDLKKVEVRLGGVENRLGGVENRLDGVENRLEKVEEGLLEVKSELMYVKTDVRDLKADTPTEGQFKDHEKRIVRLEKVAFSS